MAISICDVHTNNDQKDITPYGSISFPVACYEDDMQILDVPVHWHDEYEFIVATEGTVTVLANAEEIVLNAGESVFINSECLHGVLSVTDEVSVLRSLVILPKFIGGSSESIIFQKLITPLSTQDAPSFILFNNHYDWQNSIADHMLKAWIAITSETYDFENESRYYISKAIRIIVDHLSDINHSYKASDIMLERIKTCLSHIESNYETDISNLDLTKICGCSESVLLRSFKQIMGLSPQQYLINFRIQKATGMLLSTNLKSRDIATACGFKDFSYFTKMFKRIIGMTPMEYRNSEGK